MWFDGFGAGLKFALLFLLAFALVQYPAELCLALALLAGIVGGILAAWWQAKETTPPPTEDTPEGAASPWRDARRQLMELRQRLKTGSRRRRSPRLHHNRRRR